MIKLTDRLLAAASLVKGGGIVADIGTDHAYLPIYLIQNGKVDCAIAADIGKGPLENARKSVEGYCLEDKISLRLSDGLNSFKDGEVQEIVFAGMGGTLITEKLKETEWIKNEKYHFVFQPQSRAEELREYLLTEGFSINKESAVCEGRRYYVAFDASYTGDKRLPTHAECFLGKLPNTNEAKGHIEHQLHRLEKRYESGVGSEDERTALFETINALKDFTYKKED